jgi:hypothetical protein
MIARLPPLLRGECTLRGVLILAAAFPAEPRDRLETLIHRHIQEVATREWPMMARKTATLEIVSRQLAEALQLYARPDAHQPRPGCRTT